MESVWRERILFLCLSNLLAQYANNSSLCKDLARMNRKLVLSCFSNLVDSGIDRNLAPTICLVQVRGVKGDGGDAEPFSMGVATAERVGEEMEVCMASASVPSTPLELLMFSSEAENKELTLAPIHTV